MNLCIQDTSGQQEYSALQDQLLSNADGVIYALSTGKTEEIKEMREEFLRIKPILSEKSVSIRIAGITDKNSIESAAEYQKELTDFALKYHDVNVESVEAVDKFFYDLASELLSDSNKPPIIQGKNSKNNKYCIIC